MIGTRIFTRYFTRLLTMSLTEFSNAIWLGWLDLDIERNSDCSNDWVKVYDPSNNEVYGE